MFKSLQVEVGTNPILLWEAAAPTRVTVRAVAASGVRIGDKDMTAESSYCLTANVGRDVQLYKGDGLYGMSPSNNRIVELLVQEESA